MGKTHDHFGKVLANSADGHFGYQTWEHMDFLASLLLSVICNT